MLARPHSRRTTPAETDGLVADKGTDLATGQGLGDYRNHLVTSEQKAQEDYDKTVLSLSGAALAISFAFIRDIVGPKPFVSADCLLASWVLWGGSIASALLSYFFSHLALRRAIRQVDQGRIRNERPGGCYDIITELLNGLGGLLFLSGVVLMIYFVSQNLPKGGN